MPTPTCNAVAGRLKIAKIASNYNPAAGSQITYTICVINNTGGPVSIHNVQDTFPNEWFWGSPGCGPPATATLACSQPSTINGGGVTWANPQAGNPPITINDGQQINLTVTGSYQGAAVTPGSTWCNRFGSDYTVAVLGSPPITGDTDPCVVIQ
jgi:uncharacterized repeat protein (TIGR01451 family)